jgi:hypothetical protein
MRGRETPLTEFIHSDIHAYNFSAQITQNTSFLILAPLGPHGKYLSSVAQSGHYFKLAIVLNYYLETESGTVACLAVVACHLLCVSHFILQVLGISTGTPTPTDYGDKFTYDILIPNSNNNQSVLS